MPDREPLRGVHGDGRTGWCRRCEQWCGEGLPDPCLGTIPGVSHACCGHHVCEAYVVLGGKPDEPVWSLEQRGVPILVLRGDDATAFFAVVRRAASDSPTTKTS